MKKSWRKYNLVLTTVLLLIIEAIFFSTNFQTFQVRCVIGLGVIVFTVLLLVYLITNKKSIGIIKAFISMHHGDAKSLSGLIIIVFVFIQLHIIATEIHHSILPKDVEDSMSHHFNLGAIGYFDLNWVLIITYLCFLYLPFLLSACYKFKTTIQRKVLVTGLSVGFNDTVDKIAGYYNVDSPERSFNEKIILKSQTNSNWNWYAIKKNLIDEKYKEISTVIFILDKKAFVLIENVNKTLSAKLGIPDFSILGEFANKVTGRKIVVETVDAGDFNDFDQAYKQTKRKLEKIFRQFKFSHEQIIFNITPGTAITSAALTLFCIKGQRGMCYLTQILDEYKYFADPANGIPSANLGEIKEFDLSVNDLEDIVWDYLELKQHQDNSADL